MSINVKVANTLSEEPSCQGLKLTGNFQANTLKCAHVASCAISPVCFGMLTGVTLFGSCLGSHFGTLNKISLKLLL